MRLSRHDKGPSPRNLGRGPRPQASSGLPCFPGGDERLGGLVQRRVRAHVAVADRLAGVARGHLHGHVLPVDVHLQLVVSRDDETDQAAADGRTELDDLLVGVPAGYRAGVDADLASGHVCLPCSRWLLTRSTVTHYLTCVN